MVVYPASCHQLVTVVTCYVWELANCADNVGRCRHIITNSSSAVVVVEDTKLLATILEVSLSTNLSIVLALPVAFMCHTP